MKLRIITILCCLMSVVICQAHNDGKEKFVVLDLIGNDRTVTVAGKQIPFQFNYELHSVGTRWLVFDKMSLGDEPTSYALLDMTNGTIYGDFSRAELTCPPVFFGDYAILRKRAYVEHSMDLAEVVKVCPDGLKPLYSHIIGGPSWNDSNPEKDCFIKDGFLYYVSYDYNKPQPSFARFCPEKGVETMDRKSFFDVYVEPEVLPKFYYGSEMIMLSAGGQSFDFENFDYLAEDAFTVIAPVGISEQSYIMSETKGFDQKLFRIDRETGEICDYEDVAQIFTPRSSTVQVDSLTITRTKPYVTVSRTPKTKDAAPVCGSESNRQTIINLFTDYLNANRPHYAEDDMRSYLSGVFMDVLLNVDENGELQYIKILSFCHEDNYDHMDICPFEDDQLAGLFREIAAETRRGNFAGTSSYHIPLVLNIFLNYVEADW